MAGQKQSFRFRLPWLPSLVSAPGRSSMSQRSRKTPPPPPVNLVDMDMIPIQRQIVEIESESLAQATRPLVQPESQTPLLKTDLDPHQPLQLNQQQLTESGRLSKRTDPQSPSGQVEAAVREEPAEFHIHLSGTDSTPLQVSNTSPDPVQTSPDHASKSQEAESQHLLETEFPSPLATKNRLLSPTRESKLLSLSKGAKLIQQKLHLSKSSSSSSSSSSPQKPSPTRAKSKPHSPSHTSTSARANPKSSPDARNHTRSSPKQSSLEAGNHTRYSAKQPSPEARNHTLSSGKQPSRDAGNHTRSNLKQPSPDAGIQTRSSFNQLSPDAGNTRSSPMQPSPDAGIHTRSSAKQQSPSRDADTRKISLLPIPSHTVKSAQTWMKSSSKSSSSSSSSSSPSLSSNSSSSSSPSLSSNSSSPPYSPSSQSCTSSYLTGESWNSSSKQQTSSPTPKNSPDAQTPMLKTHTSQEYKHNSILPQEESNQPYATKSTDLEAIQANESHTLVTVSNTRFMEHLSTEEASETGEDESHKSGTNKRKRKLFLKKVSPREDILMPHNSHKGDSQSKIPLHKEIKREVSNFTEKVSLGKLGQHSRIEDHPVSIITISGDNKGATFHLNGKGPSQITITNSDSAGTQREDPRAKYEQQKRMSCVNSNIQSINNSLLLNSSVHERNPGVHFVTLGKNTKFSPAGSKRYEPPSSDDVHEKEVNVTTARKLEYNRPIIKRRCLRGLLMESSESDAYNPDKPRRHGCRAACGDKGKYDF